MLKIFIEIKKYFNTNIHYIFTAEFIVTFWLVIFTIKLQKIYNSEARTIIIILKNIYSVPKIK